MRIHKGYIGLFVALLALGGCYTVPSGPSVMVLPPQGKPFELFQADDASCRQWARQQIGLSPQEVANQNTASGVLVGTAVGAAIGTAIGATTGSAGAGAAIGAGTGLLFGSASGSSAGQYYGYEAQRRYDIAYEQCMYAKGNIIPGVVRRVVRTLPPPPDLSSTSPQSYEHSPLPPPPPALSAPPSPAP